jgi:hypothetical protein
LNQLLFAAATGGILLIAQQGLAADVDGDLIDDSADNCSSTANAQQLDADGDGVGNACDADYNNDGVVDDVDFDLISGAYNSGVGSESYDAIFDHNADGLVNAKDITVHLSLRS